MPPCGYLRSSVAAPPKVPRREPLRETAWPRRARQGQAGEQRLELDVVAESDRMEPPRPWSRLCLFPWKGWGGLSRRQLAEGTGVALAVLLRTGCGGGSETAGPAGRRRWSNRIAAKVVRGSPIPGALQRQSQQEWIFGTREKEESGCLQGSWPKQALKSGAALAKLSDALNLTAYLSTVLAVRGNWDNFVFLSHNSVTF